MASGHYRCISRSKSISDSSSIILSLHLYRFVYCIYIYIYIVYIESAAKLTLCGCLRSLVRSVETALAYNKTQVFIRSHLCYLLTQVNCKFISKFSLHLFLLHSKKKKQKFTWITLFRTTPTCQKKLFTGEGEVDSQSLLFLKSNDTYQKTFWTTEVASFLMDSNGDC